MYWIILSVVLFSIIIILLITNNYNKKIKNINDKFINQINIKLTEEYNKKKEELLKEYNIFENNIKNKKQLQEELLSESEKRIQDSINKEKVIIQQNLENQRILLLQNIEKEIKEKQLSVELDYSKFIENIAEVRTAAELSLTQLIEEVDQYRNARDSIIKIQKEEEKIKNERNFYSINLTEEDLEDIIELRKLEQRIRHKDILNKLIFEAYIKKPFTNMCSRILSTTKVCGIYKITNLNNNLVYIGKSTDIKARWQEHIKSAFNIGTIAHAKIHDAIKKEGIENFIFQLVEECTKDSYSDREKYWIEFYQSMNYGYNERNG